MLRRLYIAGVVLCFCLFFSGCFAKSIPNTNEIVSNPEQSEAPLYELITDNGKLILRFTKEGRHAMSGVEIQNGSLLYPGFSSLPEMMAAIEDGNLSVQNLTALWKESDHPDEIDLSRVFEPSLPDGLTVKNIQWTADGIQYYFDLGMIGYITNPELYEACYADYESPVPDNEKIEILSDEQISDRNARQIVYKLPDSDRTVRILQYALETESSVIYVIENYYDEIDAEPTDTPESVYFFGTGNGAQMHGRLSGLTQRPTAEWLCAFRLTEYKK